MSAGPTGVQGYQGVLGAQGATGATGVGGNPGPAGGQGVIGVQGATGPAGAIGGFSFTTISSFNQAIIANTIPAANSTVGYISQLALPAATKGRAGTLSIFFNLSTLNGFSTTQFFDYGLYLDGVGLGIGDTTTSRYVQSVNSGNAVSWGGFSLGSNGMTSFTPITIPITVNANSCNLQIGIKNSSAALNTVASISPSATVSTGFTVFGSNSYTVPTTAGGSNVVGIYAHIWGCGGTTENTVNSNGAGGPGGYTTGFYACPTGTTLTVIVGTRGLAASFNPVPLHFGAGGWQHGGGFSGIFTSNILNTSTVIAVAGGGGGTGNVAFGGGGAGGGSNGGVPWSINSNSAWPSITSSGQSTASTGRFTGTQWYGQGQVNSGGNAQTAGGGGWYGGNTTSDANISGGGSGFTSNFTAVGATYQASTLRTSITYLTQNTSNRTVFATTMSNFGYSPATFAYGGVNNLFGGGLVIIVPAVGTNPVYVGTQATMFM